MTRSICSERGEMRMGLGGDICNYPSRFGFFHGSPSSLGVISWGSSFGVMTWGLRGGLGARGEKPWLRRYSARQ